MDQPVQTLRHDSDGPSLWSPLNSHQIIWFSARRYLMVLVIDSRISVSLVTLHLARYIGRENDTKSQAAFDTVRDELHDGGLQKTRNSS